MSAQTSYGFNTVSGIAGGLVDLNDYTIDAFANEEESGVLKYGEAVVAGTVPGKTIALPTSDSTDSDFLGVTVNGLTTEHDLEGRPYIRKTASVGVLAEGRIWVRVPEDTEIAYGDTVCFIKDGDNAGYFTNDSSSGTAIKGRFIGTVDTTAWIAPAEIYDQIV